MSLNEKTYVTMKQILTSILTSLRRIVFTLLVTKPRLPAVEAMTCLSDAIQRRDFQGQRNGKVAGPSPVPWVKFQRALSTVPSKRPHWAHQSRKAQRSHPDMVCHSHREQLQRSSPPCSTRLGKARIAPTSFEDERSCMPRHHVLLRCLVCLTNLFYQSSGEKMVRYAAQVWIP